MAVGKRPSGFLGDVAMDHNFPGVVRSLNCAFFMEKDRFRLLVESKVGMHAGMDKNMGCGFMEGQQAVFEEVPMRLGDAAQSWVFTGGGVRTQGGAAPGLQPLAIGLGTGAGPVHQDVVIAPERDQPVQAIKAEDFVEDSFAVRAFVDIVAQENKGVVPAQTDQCAEGAQGSKASMNVAKDQMTAHAGAP